LLLLVVLKEPDRSFEFHLASSDFRNLNSFGRSFKKPIVSRSLTLDFRLVLLLRTLGLALSHADIDEAVKLVTESLVVALADCGNRGH
jgi:hypothetical protein